MKRYVDIDELSDYVKNYIQTCGDRNECSVDSDALKAIADLSEFAIENFERDAAPVLNTGTLLILTR